MTYNNQAKKVRKANQMAVKRLLDWNTIFLKGTELNYLELFIRTSLLFPFLYFSGRVMGFRQPSTIMPYNFLVAAGMSHIAASRMVNPESRLIDALVIIIVFTLVHLLISYLQLKIPQLVTQNPIVLVEKGVIKESSLKKVQLTIDNLFSIMRLKGGFNLKNVAYVIAEPVGDFSVAINTESLPVTKKTMGIEPTLEGLSQIIIYDGVIDYQALKSTNKDIHYLEKELKCNSIDDVKEVFLGIITPEGSLYINRRGEDVD